METTTAITMVCITLFKEELISSLGITYGDDLRFSSASVQILDGLLDCLRNIHRGSALLLL